MSHMANPQGDQSPTAVRTEPRSRRRRAAVTASDDQFENQFERAFADALRDILRHERRRIAA